nr:MAG TPA: hypothetical protein [Crassvirales sp.]
MWRKNIANMAKFSIYIAYNQRNEYLMNNLSRIDKSRLNPIKQKC